MRKSLHMKRKKPQNIYIWELQNVVSVTSLMTENETKWLKNSVSFSFCSLSIHRVGILDCQLDLLKFLLVSELKYRLERGVLNDAVDWNPSSVF